MATRIPADDLVDCLVRIVLSARSAGVDRLELLQDNQFLYRHFRSQLQDLRQVRQAIESANPDVIDHRLITWEIDGAVAFAISSEEFDETAFRQKMLLEVSRLINHLETREMHVQLVNLISRADFPFGDVEIRPIANFGDTTEHNLKYESPVKSPDPTPINAYAVVMHAKGYSSVAERNAIATIEDALRLVRGIGLPSLIGKGWKQFGVEGRSPGSTWAITRQGPGKWNSAVDFTMMDRFIFLSDLLRNYLPQDIDRLERIYLSPSKSKIERKVLQSHYWMGDATMPGSNAEKYTKLALAFEAAIGGEAEKVAAIGITEMLAERVAFLLGDDQVERLQWHSSVRALYRLRSKIMHGDSALVSDGELVRWAFIVSKVAKKMLRLTNEFRTVEDLDTWVRNMRYQ